MYFEIQKASFDTILLHIFRISFVNMRYNTAKLTHLIHITKYLTLILCEIV